MKENIKKISKYTVNVLNIINALFLGLSPIWGLNTDKITASVTVIVGIISFYLL